MATMRHPLRLGFALAVLILFGSAESAEADGGFVILCHASNPVTTLSSTDLKKALIGGTKQWPNGAVVQIGVPPSDSRELGFLAGTVEMTPPQLLSRIQQQVFNGEMRRPIMLRSSAECIGLARGSAGGICAAAAGAALPPEVKIIQVR